MITRVLLERVHPGHTRLVELVVREHQVAVLLRQSTDGEATLAGLPTIRLRRGSTIEKLFEQDLVARLLARGYRPSPGQDADVEALVERLAPDVERERRAFADEVASIPSKLEALPNVTVARGTPITGPAVEEAERALGVRFSPSYRRFLTSVGSLRAGYARGQRTELWVLGAPLPLGDETLDIAAAREIVKSKLAARRASFPPDVQAELTTTWAEQPTVIVPVLTTVSGYSSDLAAYDGFPEHSEAGSPDGQIFCFDEFGRLCHCGLRYAEVTLEGASQLWDDFDDVLVAAANTFERQVREWEADEGQEDA